MSISYRLKQGEKLKIITYGPCFFADNLRPNPWVIALQKHFDINFPGQVQILIRGLGGVNSNWGLKHLYEKVIIERPDYVFMEWAINDAKKKIRTNRDNYPKGGVPKEKSKENLNSIVLNIQNEVPGCKIVLWTTTPISTKGRDKSLIEYYDVNRQYALDNKLPLVDLFPEFMRLKVEDAKTYWMCLTGDEGHLTRFGAKKVVIPLLLGMINEERI